MQKDPKHKYLWSIVLIELTNCCNFSCEFCPSDSIKRKKQFMKKALWQKVIREVGEKQLAPIIFLNLLGEPLLHPDVFEAIELANSLGLKVSLYTNGALLYKEKGEKLLNTLKSGRIVLSLQEISPKDFDKRAHKQLSWDSYITNLKDFTVNSENKGVSVQVHCMVDIHSLGWNIKNILKEQKAVQDIYNKWAGALKADKKFKVNIFDPARSYPLGKTTSFFVKHHGWWSNRFIPDYAAVIPNSKGHCALMNDTFAVLADGICTYCCTDFEGELNLGNASESSLEDIYNNEKATRIREEEKNGRIIEEICKICRGKLIDKGNNRPMLNRNIVSDYYFFNDHLKRYGIKSALKKVNENLKRRILKK